MKVEERKGRKRKMKGGKLRGGKGREGKLRKERRGEELYRGAKSLRMCPHSKNSPSVSYKVQWSKPDQTQKNVHRQEGEEHNLQLTRHLEERRSGGMERKRRRREEWR